MRYVKRKGGGGMSIGNKKINLNIVIGIVCFCMLFLPNLISPEYVDAASHHKKNKCRIICRHRDKHGVCLIYGQDCGGPKVKATKLYAIKPDDQEKDKKKEKNKSEKWTCHHKDLPHVSTTKKHRHMDEDCCMDPDEWENPKCDYDD